MRTKFEVRQTKTSEDIDIWAVYTLCMYMFMYIVEYILCVRVGFFLKLSLITTFTNDFSQNHMKLYKVNKTKKIKADFALLKIIVAFEAKTTENLLIACPKTNSF